MMGCKYSGDSLGNRYVLPFVLLGAVLFFFLSIPADALSQTIASPLQMKKAQAQIQPAAPSKKPISQGPAAAPTLVKRKIAPVQVSTTDLKNYKPLLEVGPKAERTKPVIKPQKKGEEKGSIEVFSPKQGDEWRAEKEYTIRWKSRDISGDVKILLVLPYSVQGAKGMPGIRREKLIHTIAPRTSNTGSYRFKVPRNLVVEPFLYRVEVSTLDGRVKGYSEGPLGIYTQDIDLACKIMNLKQIRQKEWYVFYMKGKRWIEFDVWLRNNGIKGPIDIYEVLVQIIKEPEGVVMVQEEWGYGRIYPQVWYKLSEPMKCNVSSWEVAPFYGDKNINFKKGSYRIEIHADPQNRLHENEKLRADNQVSGRFHIR